MLVEVAGNDLHFQAHLSHRQDRRFRCDPSRRSADGADWTKGLRWRSRNGAGCGIACGTTVPRLSRFAVEHLLLLPLGGADRAGVGQHRARELLLRSRSRSRLPSTTSHGALLCADHEGDRRSHGAGRRAPSVAAGDAAGGRGDGRGSGDGAHLRAHVRRAGRADVVRSAGRCRSPPISRSATSSRESSSGMHPVIPFLLLFGIASDGLGFVALALFNPVRGNSARRAAC